MAHEAEEFEIPERIRSKVTELPTGVLNAYIYGRLTEDQTKKVEEILANSKNLQLIVSQKQLERHRLKEQIAKAVFSAEARKSLSLELANLTDEAFPPNKDTGWEKFLKFLNKTIIEF